MPNHNGARSERKQLKPVTTRRFRRGLRSRSGFLSYPGRSAPEAIQRPARPRFQCRDVSFRGPTSSLNRFLDALAITECSRIVGAASPAARNGMRFNAHVGHRLRLGFAHPPASCTTDHKGGQAARTSLRLDPLHETQQSRQDEGEVFELDSIGVGSVWNINTYRPTTASKGCSNVIVEGSPSTKAILPKDRSLARSRATAIAAAERSTPTIHPVGPTNSATRKAVSPTPLPTSSTRIPGATPASAKNSRVMGSITRACTRRRSSSCLE